MSRLSRLRLSGIRSFGCEQNDEQEITFTSPVTLFLGQNGCGKTTIIESIKFAITGELPGGTKGGQGFIYDPQMAKKVETRGQVKLKFYDMKGESLTVVKIATVKQSKDKLTYKLVDSTLFRNGEAISGRCCDIHKEVASFIGVAPAIVNSVLFCHQEDSYWPLEEPKKLKERFDAIFDSVKYNKCIESIIKQRKQKQVVLKTMAVKVDFAKQTKTQMEQKKEQLHEKEERLQVFKDKLNEIESSREPVTKEFNKVIILERDINNLSTEVELLRNQLSSLQEQEQEILSNCKEIKCSDEELNDKISKFESDVKDIQNNINDLQSNIKQIEYDEEKSQKNINKNQNQLGQLQAEKKENENKIEKRNKKIDEISVVFNIKMSNNKEDVIKELDKCMTKSEEELKIFEKESEVREKELQDEIDTCRTSFAQLKQSIESKKKQIEEYKTEVNKLSIKLSELDMCDSELKHIEGRLMRIENEITEEESRMNIESVKNEIDRDKNKCKTLEEQLKKIEDEIQDLHNYSTIQTEIDLQNENLIKRQNGTQKLKLKHEENFKTIFDNNVPETNLKQTLTLYLDKQNKLLKEKNIQITNLQRKVTTLETNLNIQKDKLKLMQTDLKNDNELLNESFKNDTFENVESQMSKQIEEKQNVKSTLHSSKYLYTNFISKFKSSEPCCPICKRDVNEKDMINKIVKDLEKRIITIPKQFNEVELEANQLKEKYNKILSLKPVYYKVKKVTETEIPALKENISSLDNELDEKIKELKSLQSDVDVEQKKQVLANSLMSDVTLIDQYQKEIKNSTQEIASLKSRIPKNVTNRSKQEVLKEQEDFKSMISSARLNIETLNDKLVKHTERLHLLKDQKNNLKTKELNIKKDLQGKDQLAIKQEEFETKIAFIESEILEDESDINPMKNKLDELIKNKERNKTCDKEKRDEMSKKLNKLKEKFNEILSLHKSINEFIKNNIDEQIETIKSLIEKYRQEIKDYIESKNNITKQITEYKDQLNNRKNYYRELQDNLKLREKRKKMSELSIELDKCENKLGEHDITTIARRKIELHKKITDYNQQESKITGQKEEQENIIRELKKELAQPNFANAASNYKNIFLEYKTLDRTINDMNDFAKSLDWAMLQYHKKQMVLINQNIRDLWRSVYRGNDIDYIELKTEMDTSRSSTDKRRMYNYRLVQVKNDVELEMKGRCSAGQKVLASLIIRIALADTFSTKCGILALDEPTTNLDKENVTSLCSVICDLINRKRKQKNFQLLIITHDQEFLASLSRIVAIDEYNLVSRSVEGKSVVTRHQNDF